MPHNTQESIQQGEPVEVVDLPSGWPQVTKGNRRLKIMIDECPPSPRDWDNVGMMFCWHNRYQLGDEQPAEDPQDWLEVFKEDNPGAVILPLYLYDHSGLSMSTGAFSCPWDSGQVGWIIATVEKVKEELTAAADVEAVLRSEVETYSQYLAGTVWGYVCEELTVTPACDKCGRGEDHDWELVDSCYGFYGDSPQESGMDCDMPEEYKTLFEEL